MARVPENCPDRIVTEPNRGLAVCGILTQVTGVTDPAECRVNRDACEACCASLRSPEEINPVIASLVHTIASRIVSACGHPECSAQRTAFLMRRVVDQLSVIVPELPEDNFPPSVPWPLDTSLKAVRDNCSQSPWAVGLLTAPRAEPTIEQTLDSLCASGFDDAHIFAEPNAWIPSRFEHSRITRRARRLGNFLNFYSCLCTLLKDNPCAEAFVVFQDDIRVARGLKDWCMKQLWPLGNGVVSLFTPRIHAGIDVGWQIASPGFHRVCGAQALIFRRDVLLRFLSDPRVLQCLRHRRYGDDAVLGGWLSREGLGIAYHTPSLVEHVGNVSSVYSGRPDQRNLAEAVACVSQIKHWRSPPPRVGKIGLVGWNSPTGLGSINRDLAAHLDIKHWFAPPHPEFGLTRPSQLKRLPEVTSFAGRNELARWVGQLDWLVFAERPYLSDLPRLAAHQGVGIACIPMWEWVQPHHAWLQFVDLMICPTRIAYAQMSDWAQRYGFGWKTLFLPWPVDGALYRFRQREVCREFLFVNGWGGGLCHRLDRSRAPYRRKGLELILAAADLSPDLRFVIRSLSPLSEALPANVRIVPPPRKPAQLYDEGDVCIQPSHYEGIGLQLLECQAAGLPLITTDAPPMNEYHPWQRIPTSGQEVVSVGDGYISSELMEPEDMVEILRPLMGRDIREASRQARASMDSEHNWGKARKIIHSELVKR